MKVLVELKNDVTVKGVLDECDLGMNIVIKDAIQENLQGVKTELALMFIQGRRIRFIHIPKSVNVSDAVEAQRERIRKAEVMYTQAMGGPGASSKRRESDVVDQAGPSQG
eukprot:TRINITY_DN3435_c0_g1_i1.p3 TRINITY_DN3435_c0_g1~~TRINITY_DN3435_c0_g1_i1.p3  ORF type:complete len:110 (+),score=20.90 TRINITY_DN3435_c0_g1_i1:635-964(+)